MGRLSLRWVWAACLLACNGTVDAGNTGISGGETEGDPTPPPGTTTTVAPDETSSSEATPEPTSEGTTDDGETDDDPKLDVDPPDDPLAPAFPQTCAEAADAETSVGCTFYPIFLPFVVNGDVGFVAANVSDDVAHVELFNTSGIVESVDIDPGASHVFVGGNDYRASFGNTEMGAAGYEMSSDRPLQVFAFMPLSTTFVTNDASILFPHAALGTRHRISAFEQPNDPGNQGVTVLATEDDTEVTLTLVNPDAITLAGGGIPALDYNAGNDTLTVTLDRLEHLVVTAPESLPSGERNPFYGSLVETTAPVAVYSSVGGLLLNTGANDMVHTAVPPTTTFGTQYAAAKFVPVGNAPDVWRILGHVDGTTINLSGGLEDTITLDAGEVHDIWTSASFWLEGNEPFGLLHLMTGSAAIPPLVPHDCDYTISGPGDPAMGWVFARDNWLNRYLTPVALGEELADDEWCHDHLTVVAPLDRWDEVTVDGDPLPDPFELGDNEHGYAYVPAPEHLHEVVAADGVGVQVEVYGFHHHGSYYYPGGMGLRNLNPEG